MPHLLLFGGTTEANALARALADAGIAATYSYAGRVGTPRAQPLPTRVGGFGGAQGLADLLTGSTLIQMRLLYQVVQTLTHRKKQLVST